MNEEDDDELYHIHRFRIRLGFVSVAFMTTRKGQTTNVSLSLQVWRAAVAITLFYLGD